MRVIQSLLHYISSWENRRASVYHFNITRKRYSQRDAIAIIGLSAQARLPYRYYERQLRMVLMCPGSRIRRRAWARRVAAVAGHGRITRLVPQLASYPQRGSTPRMTLLVTEFGCCCSRILGRFYLRVMISAVQLINYVWPRLRSLRGSPPIW
jgi:hypothetical protein